MTKILALGASTSSHSINRVFSSYAASMVLDASVELLDLNDFQAPIYSVNQESAQGIPQNAKRFVNEIESADGIVLSLAEHNGSYTAAFKSLLDWGTRHKQKLWSDKPMLLLSTSPGARGAATVLAAADASFPHIGAQVVARFSLPSFHDKYTQARGITDSNLKLSFDAALAKFSQAL